MQEEDGNRERSIKIRSQKNCTHLLKFTVSGQERHPRFLDV